MGTSFIEEGTLLFGVEYEGKVHRVFEIREQLVRDTVDIFENKEYGGRAERSDSFFSVCVTARRLQKVGDIPKEAITPELLMSMRQEDFNEISAASKRMEEKRRRFRAAPETGQEDHNSSS